MRVQLRTNVKHLQGTLMVPSDKSISIEVLCLEQFLLEKRRLQIF